MLSHTLNVKFWTDTIRIAAERAPQFIDITEQVVDFLRRTGVVQGMAVAFLGRLAPADAEYCHNNFAVRTVNMAEDESPNGHAHCQHLLLNTSETVPIMNGQLLLGAWQRIFFVELDRPRPRQVLVQILGV